MARHGCRAYERPCRRNVREPSVRQILSVLRDGVRAIRLQSRTMLLVRAAIGCLRLRTHIGDERRRRGVAAARRSIQHLQLTYVVDLRNREVRVAIGESRSRLRRRLARHRLHRGSDQVGMIIGVTALGCVGARSAARGQHSSRDDASGGLNPIHRTSLPLFVAESRFRPSSGMTKASARGPGVHGLRRPLRPSSSRLSWRSAKAKPSVT